MFFIDRKSTKREFSIAMPKTFEELGYEKVKMGLCDWLSMPCMGSDKVDDWFGTGGR
jgi:hypothetical protein